MDTPGVSELRLAMRLKGYAPLPAHGKEVFLKDWPLKGDVPVEEVANWLANHPEWPNTGMLTRNTPVFDVDILHPEAAGAVEALARELFDDRGVFLVRYGLPPKRAVLFRTGKPFEKHAVRFRDPKGDEHKIEILGDGQQLIVAGIHPETKRPYSWHGGTPWECPWSDLPEIDEDDATTFLTLATEMLVKDFGFQVAEDAPKANGHDKSHGSDFIAAREHVDVDALLADLRPSGDAVNDTLMRVIPSLLRRGEHPADVLDRVVDAVMQMAAQHKKLRWSQAIEVKANRRRVLSGYRLLLKDYDPATGSIPEWLPGEFHADWLELLREGITPTFAFNRGGFYVKRPQGTRKADHEPRQEAAGTGQEAPAHVKPGPAAAEGDNGKRKFRFPVLRFGEMRPGSEPDYLVDELIPMAGLVVVYGAPKSGKSFWVLDLVLHIALAWEYRDRAVQQGSVVYCAFEGAHGYRKRCEAFRRHHSLTDEDPPLFIVPGRADLIKDHATLIRDLRGQLGPVTVRCVVLDTLNKSLIGSESKDVDMANYIAAAEAIQTDFSCVVVIVHHHGIDESRPRGHTSLRGAVAAQIKITRDDQNNIIAEIEDMRDGPDGAQIASRLVVVDVGTDTAGKPLTSAAVEPIGFDATPRRQLPKLTKNQRTFFSILQGAATGLTLDEWYEQAKQAGLGLKRRADLHDFRAGLKSRGLVQSTANKWFVSAEFKNRSE